MVIDIPTKIMNPQFIKEFPLPAYATKDSAGMDLRACIDETITLYCQETILIPTGIAIHLPNPYMMAMLAPKSGLGHKHGIVLGNLIGIGDADYQGELFVSAWNRNSRETIAKEFKISRGDWIAQMIFVPIVRGRLVPVESFKATERGEGGFGSNGTS